MSVMMVRSTIKDEKADEVEAAVRKMFAAIEKAQPAGVRYASCRLTDGTTYVALLEVEDGVQNQLPQIPEFAEFQSALQGWTAGPPAAEALTVVGSYRLFD